MNIVTRTIIGCTAAIVSLAAVSCSKDNTIRYNNATMGNIVDGRFVSDQGNIFNVVEQNYLGKLDTMKRAFIICDILNTTEGASNEYDVRLNYATKVLTKDPVILSENTDTTKTVNDPILLSDIWISGGYVNAIVTIPVKTNSSIQHMINFVVDDKAQKDSTYTFMFRHNAFGEVLASDSSKNKDMVLANGYVSFPISSIIKEDAANIVIKWNSYKVLDPGIVSSSSEEYKIERTYSKNTFEQVPSSAKSTVMAMSIE